MKNLFLFAFICSLVTVNAQIPSYVPSNGLVGWWPFNGNANDESGNGNNGTVNGATLTTDRFGNVNKAFSFDGINDYIEVQNNINLNVSNWSISAWVNPNGYYIGNVNGNISDGNVVVGKGEDFNSGYYSLSYKSQSKKARGSLGVGNLPNFVDNTSSINSSQWNQILVSWDGISMKIYTNGQLENTNSSISTSQGNNNQNLFFGTMAANNLYPYWVNGKIDDIGIWNRALTECEIQDLYHAQLGSANTSSSQTQVALDTYTWPVNNQTYTQSGIYTDTLVNAAGCDSILTLNLSMEYTGLFDGKQMNAYISPNPVKDQFVLHGATNLTALNLLDVQGNLVQTFDVQQDEFSLSNLKPGIYFLELHIGNQCSVFKLMKE